MKKELIIIGLPVVYIPTHLLGTQKIKDNQLGIVSSMNDKYIFVRYKHSETAQATSADDLYPLHNRPDLLERLGIEIKPDSKINEIYLESKKIRHSGPGEGEGLNI